MKQNINIKNNISFTSLEEKLLKKYLEEYNELYQKILIMTPNDFIQSMVKRVEITMKEKFNGFSNDTKTKIKDFIIEKIYCHDYKYALFAKKSILKRKQDQIISHYFNNEIIPHCEKDKKDGYYIHICGEKFQIFKYKPINYLSLVNKSNKDIYNNESEYLLYCIECDMIYKSDLIKFKCNSKNESFYSRLLYKKNSINNNQLATWKKYHCNIIINDSMKCQKCNENLYFLHDKDYLFCKKCNIEFDPKNLIWKCIKCKSDFIAEIKIFNPLEYKNMKICVKETIFNKKRAKPKYLACGCKIEFKKIDFFHKTSCKGKLYLGELDDKKVVVCSKCESIGMYDEYIWTCPKCLKRFKINDNKEKNDENNNNNEKENKPINRFFNYSSSNWNIKINNNASIYKSPNNYKNKLILRQKKESIEKEFKSDIKKLINFRKNNSAIKFFGKKKFPSGLPSSSQLIKDLKNDYNTDIDIKNQNNKKNNKIPNNSPNIIHNKSQSKLSEIQVKSSRDKINFKKPNRIISNIDLSAIKNLNYLFDKYIEATPMNINNPKKNFKNLLFTDADLGQKVYNDFKSKKNENNNSNKKKNDMSPKNNKVGIKNQRSNSGFIRVNINIEESFNSNKNLSKRNESKNNIIKNIINYRGKSLNKRGESTSCDSNKKINNKNSPNNKFKDNNSVRNKKIIPGKFNINNYIIKKQIGQGSFGQIFLVEDKNHNQYALKKIIAGSSNDIKSIKKEYQILIDIQNSEQEVNVVNIFGIANYQLDITTNVLYVLMELASTDWEKEILGRKTSRKYYSEKELMNILSNLVKSLSILQQQNISHRDIKPQNVLVFYDTNLNKVYKLADFGEAKELLNDDKPTNKQTLRGTELYMSPILFFALRGRKIMKYVRHNPYKSDVFSFGLCSLFAATLCFESLYDVRELKSNISLRVVVEKYLKFRYSTNVIGIISKMLDVNETTRMDFLDLEKEFNKLGY